MAGVTRGGASQPRGAPDRLVAAARHSEPAPDPFEERGAIGAVALDRRPALDDLVTSPALEESVLEPGSGLEGDSIAEGLELADGALAAVDVFCRLLERIPELVSGAQRMSRDE